MVDGGRWVVDGGPWLSATVIGSRFLAKQPPCNGIDCFAALAMTLKRKLRCAPDDLICHSGVEQRPWFRYGQQNALLGKERRPLNQRALW